MARIRSLKPEFWTDVRLARLPDLARLVYMCLISMADDEGRIEGDAETVWHFGFPRDSVEDVTRALRTLVECSRVVPYEGPEGIPLMAIPTFRKHQKIDRPSPSKLPAPPALTTDSTIIRRGFDDHSSGDRIRDQGSDGIRDLPRVVPEAGDQPVLIPNTETETRKAPKALRPLPPLATLWNQVAGDGGLPKVASWTSARDRVAKVALTEEPDLGIWERAFRALAISKFHKGGNDRGWKADFDFAIRPSQRGKWLDEARNATATENHAPILTPEQQAADMARRIELTNRVRNGTH